MVPILYKCQWCSRDRNLRDRDLAEASRPRRRLCHKSRDQDLKADTETSRPSQDLDTETRDLTLKAETETSRPHWWQMLQEIFEMLPNTNIKVFAVAMLQ